MRLFLLPLVSLPPAILTYVLCHIRHHNPKYKCPKKCHCDVVVTSLGCRTSVTPTCLRCCYDVTAMSLQCHCDVAYLSSPCLMTMSDFVCVCPCTAYGDAPQISSLVCNSKYHSSDCTKWLVALCKPYVLCANTTNNPTYQLGNDST
jgi:hypothetical protein